DHRAGRGVPPRRGPPRHPARRRARRGRGRRRAPRQRHGEAAARHRRHRRPVTGRGGHAPGPRRPRLVRPHGALPGAEHPADAGRAGLAAGRRHRAARHDPDAAPQPAPPGRAGGRVPALGPGAGPARPRTLRPGGDRGPRAPVPADGRPRVHRHAAGPVGQVQRRPEEAHHAVGALRHRPADPADRRAARGGPHRHRSAVAVPPTGRRRLRRRAGHALGPGGHRPRGALRARPRPPPDPRRPRPVRPGADEPRRQRRPARRGHGVRHRGHPRGRRAAVRRRGGRGRGGGDQPCHPQAGLHEVLEARHPRWLRAGHVHRARPGHRSRRRHRHRRRRRWRGPHRDLVAGVRLEL
ncbi:MAG: FIG00474675: hypothetical protein, partial [uncultured Nocardioidaceae bacterium]